MNYEATFDISKDPDTIFKALQPEQSEFKRASWTVHKEDGKAQIRIKADDAVALKAMVSTVLKALTLYEKAR